MAKREAKREPYAKLSVSIPRRLASEVRKQVGSRGVSAFTARAMRHELERQRLREYLDELEAELGPPDPDLMREIEDMWPET